MHKATSEVSKWRSLLTECLPYEVPVIFSNDILFASLLSSSASPDAKEILDKSRKRTDSFTIPYTYNIAKDTTRTTSLAIIHPIQQLRIAEFYEDYNQSMLDYCNRSEVSLRRPIAETSVFSDTQLSDDSSLKNGIPHINPDDGEIDIAHMPSYFTYGKYNLLGKFVDSAEYRRFEKRFKFMRTIDVSRCFFNIYTHSITWATKGKDFAKEHGDTYSFENRFDRLMQRANHNETNGIVVGPEVSRIFAEIIFQDIDRQLRESLSQLSLEHDKHYAARRYVDDFFLFSNSEEELDRITRTLERILEGYKLFINSAKTRTVHRPFVSEISLARSELGDAISEMHAKLDEVLANDGSKDAKKPALEIRRKALDIRLICERHGVSFSSLSGWLMSVLRALIKRVIVAIKTNTNQNSIDALADVSIVLLDVAFYICALDLRVRSTYSICQILSLVGLVDANKHPDIHDRMIHVATTEINDLIRTQTLKNDDKANDPIELYNLLIAGAHFLGPEFTHAGYAGEALRKIASLPNVSYFGYIACKFCFLKDSTRYATDLTALNRVILDRLVKEASAVSKKAELYLLFCDFVSAPDVGHQARRKVVKAVCGGNPSNAVLDELKSHLAFADWGGLRIEHLVARKALRPVYSWA
jgi:hypothetical protein